MSETASRDGGAGSSATSADDARRNREPGRLSGLLPSPPPVGSDGPSPDALAQNSATNVTSYLIAGPVTFGGLGWLADRWLGTHVLTPIGLVVGVALAMYVVWFRYGRTSTPEQPISSPDEMVRGAAVERGPERTPDSRPDGADDEEKR